MPTKEQLQRLQALLATAGGSEGQPPVGPGAQFRAGLMRQLSLGYIQPEIELPFTIGEGAASIAGEIAGALPTSLAALRLASFLPLARAIPGRNIAENIARYASQGAIAFGALGAARQPQLGESRLENAVIGAIQGAIEGPSLAPGSSPLIAATTGAVASTVPRLFDRDIGGREIALNAGLAALLQLVGNRIDTRFARVSSETPPVPEIAVTPEVSRPNVPTPPPVATDVTPTTAKAVQQLNEVIQTRVPGEIKRATALGLRIKPEAQVIQNRIEPTPRAVEQPPLVRPTIEEQVALPFPQPLPIRGVDIPAEARFAGRFDDVLSLTNKVPLTDAQRDVMTLSPPTGPAFKVADIQIESLSSKITQLPGARPSTVLTTGLIDPLEPAIGYRIVSTSEVDDIVNSGFIHSLGTDTEINSQLLSRATLFSNSPLPEPVAKLLRGRNQVQIAVDLRGLPFATLAQQSGNRIAADFFDGLGITVPIPKSRIVSSSDPRLGPNLARVKGPAPKLTKVEVVSLAEAEIDKRVAGGRRIPLDEIAAPNFPNDAAGVELAADGRKSINTAGLTRSQLDELLRVADSVGDNDLVKTLQATIRGLEGGRGRAAKAPIRERRLEVKRTISGGDIVRLVDDADAEVLHLAEFDTPVNSILTAKESIRREQRIREQLARIPEETGSVISYEPMLKALAQRKVVITEFGEGGGRLLMPDGETKAFGSREEFESFVGEFLRESDVAPVYAGPDLPPLDQPKRDVKTAIQKLLFPEEELRALQAAIPPEVALEIRLREALKTKVEVAPDETTALEAAVDALPPSDRIAKVKTEAASKGIEVITTPDSVVIDNRLTGERTVVQKAQELLGAAAQAPPKSIERQRLLGRAEALMRLAARKVATSNNFKSVRTEEQYRSLFRRAFAGKNAQARNRVRMRYRLYERFFPEPGEALRPGERAINSLKDEIDHRVPPLVELTPDNAPPIGGTPGKPPVPPSAAETSPDWSHLDPNDLRIAGGRRAWSIMKTWALDLENKTNGAIPAFSRIFDPLDKLHQTMVDSVNLYYRRIYPHWKKLSTNREARERVTLWLEADDRDAAIKEFGIRPEEVESGKALESLYNELWKTLGFVDDEGKLLRGVEFIRRYSPRMRSAADTTAATLRQLLGKEFVTRQDYRFFAALERTGELAPREMDAFKLFSRYVYLGFRDKHLGDSHMQAVSFVRGLELPTEAQGIRDSLLFYLDTVWGATEPGVRRFNETTKGILSKLGIKFGEDDRTNFVNMLLQLNVGANIAWRIPLMTRNFWQLMLAYPFLGEKYFSIGTARSMTKRGWQEASADGVISPSSDVPLVNEINDPFGLLPQAVRHGTKAYRNIDNLTRAGAYLGMKAKVRDAALKFLQGRQDLKSFIREAELESTLHPVEIQSVVRTIQSGHLDDAAKQAARYFSDNTNFIYRAGNAPESFRGVAGRLFGQFGIWPTSYIQYVRYLAKYGAPADRAKKWARFFAMNFAFGYAGEELGVDFWKWVMFGPLVFTGGPIIDVAKDVATVGDAAARGEIEESPEAMLALQRLKTGGVTQFIPGSGALRDIERVLDAYGTRDRLTSVLTGQTPTGFEIDTSRPPTQGESLPPTVQRLMERFNKRERR